MKRSVLFLLLSIFSLYCMGMNRDSLKISERPKPHSIGVIIKLIHPDSTLLGVKNLISISDTSLKNSFPLIRLKGYSIFKAEIPKIGSYKISFYDSLYGYFETWVKLKRPSKDTLNIVLPLKKLVSKSAWSSPQKDTPKSKKPEETKNMPLITHIGLLDLLLPGLFLICLTGFILLYRAIEISRQKLISILEKAFEKSNSDKVPIIIKETLSSHNMESIPTIPKKGSLYYLEGEILMTSGPRKRKESGKINDVDLGEDVCGLALTPERSSFWLMDGTSDQFSLLSSLDTRDLFSSRLLAQSLAIELRPLAVLEGQFLEPFYGALENIRKHWIKKLNQISEHEKKELIQIIKNSPPICSSTILLGSMNIHGDCRVFRSGDSKVLVFGNSYTEEEQNPLKNHPGDKIDRLFFRLVYTSHYNFDIEYNKPSIESQIFSNVDTLIAFSDGVGEDLEEYLGDLGAGFHEEARKIIPILKTRTSDDKSLCLLTRTLWDRAII